MKRLDDGSIQFLNLRLYPNKRNRTYVFQIHGEGCVKCGQVWYMLTPKGFRKAYYAVEESPNYIQWYSTDCVTILRYYDD